MSDETDVDSGPVKQALLEACEAVGGQTALARLLGLKSQGAISSMLLRGVVPGHHVLRIESLSGVSRHRLAPKLYPIESSSPSEAIRRSA